MLMWFGKRGSLHAKLKQRVCRNCVRSAEITDCFIHTKSKNICWVLEKVCSTAIVVGQTHIFSFFSDLLFIAFDLIGPGLQHRLSFALFLLTPRCVPNWQIIHCQALSFSSHVDQESYVIGQFLRAMWPSGILPFKMLRCISMVWAIV